MSTAGATQSVDERFVAKLNSHFFKCQMYVRTGGTILPQVKTCTVRGPTQLAKILAYLFYHFFVAKLNKDVSNCREILRLSTYIVDLFSQRCRTKVRLYTCTRQDDKAGIMKGDLPTNL